MTGEGLRAEVVVVGSGGAGLTAAIRAHDGGARVIVLERTPLVGGTTAISGGALWIPLNPHMHKIGIEDSREEALAYCLALTQGRTDPALVERFVDAGPLVVRYLEARTPARFTPWSLPDYRQEKPGAKLGGRAIEPTLFETRELGAWAKRVRPSPILTLPLTLEESTVIYAREPERLTRELVSERLRRGLTSVGNALVGMLLAGCLQRGVQILTGTRAHSLVMRDGAVAGVRASREGEELVVHARAVILAAGGYEWDEELRRAFLPGRLTHPQSPPFNEGDALRMAMEVGAALANMSEAWWYPSAVVPGESYEGRPLSRQLGLERSGPHSILVNRRGMRFVNEAANYNDMGRALTELDATCFGDRNLPCWLVFDAQHRQRYRVLTLRPGDPDPEWLLRDGTLEGLARKAGVSPPGLRKTVERFNAMVREGADRDFDRGGSAYDRATGDVRLELPNLGALEKPPYYALPVYLGAVGTKGGPRTNADAQVLDVRGLPIPGLYAAGNTAGGISGAAYFGGGTSIGCGVVGGFLAGQHAAAHR